MHPQRLGMLLMLAALLSLARPVSGQSTAVADTLLWQNWEGTGFVRQGNGSIQPLAAGSDGQFGFRQYNNQTWSWQNVWARGGETGLNSGLGTTFRKPDTLFGAPRDSTLPQPFPANHTPGGLRGAHITTARHTAANHETNGYHRRPAAPLGSTSATSTGLYSPVLPTMGYDSIRVSVWVKAGGQAGLDFGSLRYHAGIDTPAAPLPDGVPASAPPGFWTPAEPDSSLIGNAPPGTPPSYQITGLPDEFVRARFTLPAATADQPGLRIALWWQNNSDGQGSFPPLTADDLLVEGFRAPLFETSALPSSVYCPQALIEVGYRVEPGLLAAGDTLVALISDVSGDFSNADTLGTATYTAGADSGSVAGQIPAGLPTGTGGYRVRVAAAGGQEAGRSPTVVSLRAIAPSSLLALDSLPKCRSRPVELTPDRGTVLNWFRGSDLFQAYGPDTLAVIPPGAYHAEVRKQTCRFRTDTVMVLDLPKPLLQVNVSALPSVVCFPQNEPLPPASGTPPGGSFEYIGEGPVGDSLFNSVLAGTGTHQLWLVYEDPNTCRDSLGFQVRVPEPLFPRLEPPPREGVLCLNDSQPKVSVAPAGEGVLWQDSLTTPTRTLASAGTFYALVQDSLGCSYVTDTVEAVLQPPPPAPVITAVEDDTARGTAEAPDGTRVLLFAGDSTKQVGQGVVQDSMWQIAPDRSLASQTTLWARLRVDQNCDSLVTEADPPGPLSPPFLTADVKLPTAISPNGDGMNDQLAFGGTPDDPRGEAFLADYPNMKLRIFNRWGQEVYRQQPYRNDWRGDDLPESTYFYILTLRPGMPPIKAYVSLHR